MEISDVWSVAFVLKVVSVLGALSMKAIQPVLNS